MRQQQRVRAAEAATRREGNGSSRVDNKRKADCAYPEDPVRDDGKWMRTEGNKRKIVEEEEESMSRKTVKYLKTVERTEAKKESEETLEVVELAEVEVNEEEVEWSIEGGGTTGGRGRPLGSGASPTRSEGGDELQARLRPRRNTPTG